MPLPSNRCLHPVESASRQDMVTSRLSKLLPYDFIIIRHVPIAVLYFQLRSNAIISGSSSRAISAWLSISSILAILSCCRNLVSCSIKQCPICGYPLQLRYKQNYGLKLWMCTNEPELCDFMTNDLSGGRLSIIKCDQCKDGYLIVKPGKGDRLPFLGCTNYKHDGTGCSGFMTMDYYLRNMDARFEELKEELK